MVTGDTKAHKSLTVWRFPTSLRQITSVSLCPHLLRAQGGTSGNCWWKRHCLPTVEATLFTYGGSNDISMWADWACQMLQNYHSSICFSPLGRSERPGHLVGQEARGNLACNRDVREGHSPVEISVGIWAVLK